MLSIIICSKSSSLAEAVSLNIKETVGLEHEIIVINNAVNALPIGQQYNNGASRAVYDYLLFVHEDVAFKTESWGKELIAILKDNSIGVVGVAGSKCYPSSPGTWPNSRKYIRENVFYNEQYFFENPDKEKYAEVVTLDGVFLACRKDVWNSTRFDNNNNGFHFYDIDFCFNVLLKNLKLVVTYEITINHFSLGSLNKSWIDQSIIFYNKWKQILPLVCIQINPEEMKSIKSEKLRDYINVFCLGNNGSNRLWLLQLYLSNRNLLDFKASKLVLRYLVGGKINVQVT